MVNPIKNLSLSKYPGGDITQWFGENPQLYARFNLAGHNGIDIVRPHGEVMYAIEDGTILEAKDNPDGYGRYLRLVGDAKADNGHYREWTYGHCSKLLVKQGEKVTAGQAIALMGNTGFVISGPTPFWTVNPYAGTHLHLGLRYCKKVKTGWAYPGSDLRIAIVDHGNGYMGSVNPVEELWECEDIPEANIWRQSAFIVISLANQVISLIRK